jgi:HPt (histidine-containing phosphotransfer) domain-containing protein
MRGDKEKCLAAGCDDYISKPINRKQLVEALKTYLNPSTILIHKVDAAADEVEQLTQLCDEAQGSQQTSSPSEDFNAGELIDFKAVEEICGDLEVIKQVADMFLKDSPKCIKSIAEVIKEANPKHIKMYAHSLKGAALQIGAKKLADVAYKLECAGRDKDMTNAPVLFNTVQDEYSQLKLLLSQDNWIELAQKAAD